MAVTAKRYLVEGEISFATIVALEKNGEQLLTEHDNLLIDFQNALSEDSSGVSLLTAWARAANRAGMVVKFVNVPARLQAMVKLGGLDKLLPIE